MEIKRQFGQTYIEFATRFNPGIQSQLLAKKADFVQCYHYPYPTLTSVAKAYTIQAAINWLKIQFDNLGDFVGAREKMSDFQLEELSTLFYYECFYLNISEVALFIIKLKLGHYGEFYGTVDPLRIMNAKNHFLSERQRELQRYDEKQQRELQEKKREQWSARAVSYETYRALKRLKARKKIKNLRKKIHRKRYDGKKGDDELQACKGDDHHGILS
jgi:hypothetical protein